MPESRIRARLARIAHAQTVPHRSPCPHPCPPAVPTRRAAHPNGTTSTTP
ncbi:hypothetical protein GLA29479_5219 [Lysobacter antibioticus]|nr:hypothetical protein GLA29479_5219 [Lysobacter antibioticus]